MAAATYTTPTSEAVALCRKMMVASLGGPPTATRTIGMPTHYAHQLLTTPFQQHSLARTARAGKTVMAQFPTTTSGCLRQRCAHDVCGLQYDVD